MDKQTDSQGKKHICFWQVDREDETSMPYFQLLQITKMYMCMLRNGLKLRD